MSTPAAWCRRLAGTECVHESHLMICAKCRYFDKNSDAGVGWTITTRPLSDAEFIEKLFEHVEKELPS